MAVGKGHIIAMGGGGFSMEPENPLLDDFVLSLSPQSPARVCFIPSASADSAPYLVKFYRAFSGRAIANDLTIFDPSAVPRRPSQTSEMANFIGQQDIFYVGGGNTANLLAIWRMHGIDRVLREAWRSGKIFCGVSAGMICWFRDGLTDSFGELAPLGDGLGFIEASACPHYDGEPGRPAAYRKAISDGMIGKHLADSLTTMPGCPIPKQQDRSLWITLEDEFSLCHPSIVHLLLDSSISRYISCFPHSWCEFTYGLCGPGPADADFFWLIVGIWVLFRTDIRLGDLIDRSKVLDER